MADEQAPDLVAVAEDLAAGLDDVDVDESGDVTSYRRGSAVFARVTAGALEVRLPEDIAEAALRTPDTQPVPGRPGWVRFAPANAERHVIDRATAWLHTAWRHAATG